MSGDGDATGDGDFSAIVAYEATRREKTNVLVFLRDEMMLKWEMFVRFFFQQKFSNNNKCVDPPQQTNNNCLGEGHFKQNSSSTVTKKISTITKFSTIINKNTYWSKKRKPSKN